MKTVPFERLHTLDFAVTDIAVIYQTPTWNTLGSLTGSGRIINGFLLIDKGECTYEWMGGSADLSPGSLIYLPIGSKKIVNVTRRPFSFYRICFTLTDLADGEQVIFTTDPWVTAHSVSGKLYELSQEMISTTVSRASLYRSTALMCEFFHAVSKLTCRAASSRIAPAVNYLESHYTENNDVDTLAQLCFISKSHFFRLFRSQMGMSPIEYRNRLRIERAKVLLSDGECSIGEIAAMLGFDGSYYFSRMFKSYTGQSPSRYGFDG